MKPPRSFAAIERLASISCGDEQKLTEISRAIAALFDDFDEELHRPFFEGVLAELRKPKLPN